MKGLEQLLTLLETLEEVPPEQADSLWALLVRSAEPCCEDRICDLSDQPYVWDALVWSEELKTRQTLREFVSVNGTCFLLCDDFKSRAWIVRAHQALHFSHFDAYFIPFEEASYCYIETHERHAGIGPFLLPLKV